MGTGKRNKPIRIIIGAIIVSLVTMVCFGWYLGLFDRSEDRSRADMIIPNLCTIILLATISTIVFGTIIGLILCYYLKMKSN